MRSSFLLLSALVVASCLTGCGDGAQSLNDQGYRALRYDAVIDAEYFFRYAAARLDAPEDPAPAEDPERRRTRIGELAVGAWTQPRETLERLAQALEADPRSWSLDELECIGKEYVDARNGPCAALVLGLVRKLHGADSKLEQHQRTIAKHTGRWLVARMRMGL